MNISPDEMIQKMGEALQRQKGAYFLGAGISVPSGLPSWLELIRSVASNLKIKVEVDDDFPSIAQYCVNAANGNRGPLIGTLKRELSRRAENHLNPYHIAIARTNIDTLWTTNYDDVLEKSISIPRLEVRANDADLTSAVGPVEFELIKIHGCVARSAPSEFIVTQSDYEDFPQRRPVLCQRLREDLLNRSLLFVGYGNQDPNIRTVVVEARRLARNTTREHYIIAKRVKGKEARKRQKLWLDDLSRFGIYAVMIDEYKEVESILNRLALSSRGRSVFVTGSHDKTDKIARKLGKLLASKSSDIVLLDGQSAGIGRTAANAFGETCVKQQIDVTTRIQYFPNPYTFNPEFANEKRHIGLLKRWRASLFRAAHTVVVFDGKMGTEAELEVAREMDCVIVPVPNKKSGLAAQLLKEKSISSKLSKKYLKVVKRRCVTAKDVFDCIVHGFGI